jgi:hypothetical protein
MPLALEARCVILGPQPFDRERSPAPTPAWQV